MIAAFGMNPWLLLQFGLGVVTEEIATKVSPTSGRLQLQFGLGVVTEEIRAEFSHDGRRS